MFTLRTCAFASNPSGGIFDYQGKKEQLEEILLELENPDVWADQERAQKLGQQRASLQDTLDVFDTLDSGLGDAGDLLEMAREEDCLLYTSPSPRD